MRGRGSNNNTILERTSVALGHENLAIRLHGGAIWIDEGRVQKQNTLVYLCGVRARRSVNSFRRWAICLHDGEASNNNDNDDDDLAFHRGGPERGIQL